MRDRVRYAAYGAAAFAVMAVANALVYSRAGILAGVVLGAGLVIAGAVLGWLAGAMFKGDDDGGAA